MWKNAIFDKYTKFNAPPQVFVSLNEPNGLLYFVVLFGVLFCSQVVKWHFAARELLFFCLIQFLSCDTNNRCEKRYKQKCFRNKPPLLYKPTKNCCGSA